MKLHSLRKVRVQGGYVDSKFLREIKNQFPELKNLSSETMCDRLDQLGIDVYYEQKGNRAPSVIVRLTLPFAIITFVLLLLLKPVNYLITGNWYYNMRYFAPIVNWLISLGLG